MCDNIASAGHKPLFYVVTFVKNSFVWQGPQKARRGNSGLPCAASDWKCKCQVAYCSEVAFMCTM